MLTTDNMHQGCIFSVICCACCCSVLQVLLMFILFAYFTSYTFLRVRGQEGVYVHAVLCCPLCACGEGGGA